MKIFKFSNRRDKDLSSSDLKIRKVIDLWDRKKMLREELCSSELLMEQAGVSELEIRDFFRRNGYGTFKSWRKKVRIREAKKILQGDPSMPVAAVGRAVGIWDKSNFNKQFKEETGCTPKEWRSRHVNHNEKVLLFIVRVFPIH